MDKGFYEMIFKRKSFHLFRNIGNEKISDEVKEKYKDYQISITLDVDISD